MTAPGLPRAGFSPGLVWKNGVVYLARGEPFLPPALCYLASLISYITLHPGKRQHWEGQETTTLC